MRSNVIYSFAAVFAVLAQFAAIFAAFTLSIPAIADQPPSVTAPSSATADRNVRGVGELIVEVRRPL
jgi:hypothetical protein